MRRGAADQANLIAFKNPVERLPMAGNKFERGLLLRRRALDSIPCHVG
jgi:hypothetical protein